MRTHTTHMLTPESRKHSTQCLEKSAWLRIVYSLTYLSHASYFLTCVTVVVSRCFVVTVVVGAKCATLCEDDYCTCTHAHKHRFVFLSSYNTLPKKSYSHPTPRPNSIPPGDAQKAQRRARISRNSMEMDRCEMIAVNFKGLM